MTSSMKTILVIGGTSGIGESFVRRFHSMGKKVIVTGRREARFQELKKELSGLETYTMDNTDFDAIPGHVEELFSQHSDIDTVWVNSGIQNSSSIKDPNSTTDEKIMQEINTNLTAPMILAHHIIPRLLECKSEANFMITTSGLAYLPNRLFPVYNPTKAAIHSYLVGIRQELKDTNVNVLELVPPYVATDLVAGHKDVLAKVTPMPLQDYTDSTFKILDSSKVKDLREVAAGTATVGVDAWRSSIGSILQQRGIGG